MSEDDVRDRSVLVPNWEEFVQYTSSPYSSSVVLPPFKLVLFSSGSCIISGLKFHPATLLRYCVKKGCSDSALSFFIFNLSAFVVEYNPFLIKVVSILKTRQTKSCSL